MNYFSKTITQKGDFFDCHGSAKQKSPSKRKPLYRGADLNLPTDR